MNGWKKKHGGSAEIPFRFENVEVIDGGIVIEIPNTRLRMRPSTGCAAKTFSSIVLCLAGWVPTHAVIRVVDEFRQKANALVGLCAVGWKMDASSPPLNRQDLRRCALRWRRWAIALSFVLQNHWANRNR